MMRALAKGPLAGFVVALLLAAPRASQACSVCMSGREDENQAAFLGTTLLLSVMPLAMIGGIVWWLRRRIRELDARERGEPGAVAL